MKTAFILSGEGARGGYQAGVIKQLVDKGTIPDEIHGVSSGSINAVGYSYLGADGLCDVWKNIDDIDKVFTFNKWRALWRNGVYSTKPISDLIKISIEEKTPICEAIVSILNAKTGQLARVSNYKDSKKLFKMAAVASLTIPGLIEADHPDWIDAGARQLVPLKYVIKGGATNIIVILGRPIDAPLWKSNGGIWHPFGIGMFEAVEYGYRFIDLMLYEILLRDIEKCKRKNQLAMAGNRKFKQVKLTVYGPNKFLFDSLIFRRSHEGLKQGLNELNVMSV